MHIVLALLVVAIVVYVLFPVWAQRTPMDAQEVQPHGAQTGFPLQRFSA